MDSTKTYTVEEVAKILRVRKGFVYDLIYTGRLRAFRLSERRFRISDDALRRFFEEQEKKTVAENPFSTILLHAEE